MAILVIESLARNNSKLKAAIWAMEVIFLFAGLVSAVHKLKYIAMFPAASSFNNVFRSGVNNIAIWFRPAGWFSSPLFVYIVINFMVVLIAASSIFHRYNNIENHSEALLEDDEKNITTNLQASATNLEEEKEEAVEPVVWKDIEEEKHMENTDGSSLPVVIEATAIKKNLDCSLESSPNTHEEGKEVDRIMNNKEQADNNVVVSDVDDDNMEAMWKVITEGAKKPVKHQPKRSETCPVDHDQTRMVSVQSIDSKGLLPSAAAAWRELRKSVTFNDAMSLSKRGGLMRDPSMSLDSLNVRFETFIKKFNNATRIERQESEQRFLDMMDRGH